ncbi:MAG: porin family protein [Bacteroidales bacterium]
MLKSMDAFKKNKKLPEDRNGPLISGDTEKKHGHRVKLYFAVFFKRCWSVIYALIFLFISFSAVNAQVFNAGFSGGLNISQVDGDGLAGYNKAGATFGIFVNAFLREDLNARLEINYSPKGSQLKTSLEDLRYYRMELHYIEFPVMLNYLLPAKLTAEAGLSGGYLFRAKEKDELGEIPVSDPFRKSEISALAGLSRLLTDNISLNLRISYSIIPVRKHAGGGTFYFNRGQNNNVISFTARYQF